MGAFGTIAVMVFAFVIELFKGLLKHPFGLVDVVRNLREIAEFQGCSIGFDQLCKIDIVESKTRFVERKLLLRKSKVCSIKSI